MVCGNARHRPIFSPTGEELTYPQRVVDASDAARATGRGAASLDSAPIHFDRRYSEQTEFGQPMMNSTVTLALVTGLSVAGISQYVVIVGGKTCESRARCSKEIRFTRRRRFCARASGSRPTIGVVGFETPDVKQDATVVMEFRRTMLVYRRGREPKRPTSIVKR